MNEEQTAAVNLAFRLRIRLGNYDSHLLDNEVKLLRRLFERYTDDIESEADGAVVFDGGQCGGFVNKGCDFPIGMMKGIPIACGNPATHRYAGHGFCDPHAGMVERGCLWLEYTDGTTTYETLLRAKSHRGEMVITGWFLPPSARAQV